MLPFGHMAGGFLIGTLLSVATKSRSKDARALQILGAVGGLLPDLDVLGYSVLRYLSPHRANFRTHRHHTWITHTFPFYLVPGGLIAVWASRRKHASLARYSAVLTVSACAHLMQDILGSGDGIQLLFPFNEHMFGVRLLGVHGKEWRARYIRDPIFIPEIVLILVALIVLSRSFLHRSY